MNVIKDFILLIPCYNNIDGLIRSVKSIYYPADKFELLIVDDGSAVPVSIDNLKNTLHGVVIQIIRIPQNKGIVNALNAGLKVLKERNDYKYIARLDAGDTCYPERFTKQVQFLDIHTDIFLLGTWCRFVNSKTGNGYNYITQTKHEDIVKEMHYKCSFIHPTVMLRKEVLNSIGFYPENYPDVEDYAYFWQILKHYKAEVLPQILVEIDFSNENISSRNYKKQLIYRMKVVKSFGTHKMSKFLGLFLLVCRFLIPGKMILKLKFIGQK